VHEPASAAGDACDPSPLDPRSLLLSETNFYILGAKSVGRRPGFLFCQGIAQIRALFSVIGDRADLDLYASVRNLLP